MSSFFRPLGEPPRASPGLPAPITAQEYDFIRETVYRHSRINLGPSKKELVMARLSKRLRSLGLVTYRDYIKMLQSTSGNLELTNLIDSISTNHTYFFREPQHFDFLRQVIMPEFCQDNPSPLPRALRLWSAATSTGEEPYTMGIVVDDFLKRVKGWTWKIQCTDISTRVLAMAKEGLFSKERLEQVPREWLTRYFERSSARPGFYEAKPELKRNLLFAPLNLLAPSYPFTGHFNVIFCRNVMIYFDRPTQQELVTKLTRMLDPGGYLIIGHAESLTGIQHSLKLIKPSIYRKPTLQ